MIFGRLSSLKALGPQAAKVMLRFGCPFGVVHRFTTERACKSQSLRRFAQRDHWLELHLHQSRETFGKRLKTEQSERFVPLHPHLIATGFSNS